MNNRGSVDGRANWSAAWNPAAAKKMRRGPRNAAAWTTGCTIAVSALARNPATNPERRRDRDQSYPAPDGCIENLEHHQLLGQFLLEGRLDHKLVGFGDQGDAVGRYEPDVIAGLELHPLQAQLHSLLVDFKRGQPIEVVRQVVGVIAFRIAAQRCDVERSIVKQIL